MKLIEKIIIKLYTTSSANYAAELIEKVADEYAKEVLRTYINNKSLQYKQSQGEYSLDELLNIIKKEKGL